MKKQISIHDDYKYSYSAHAALLVCPLVVTLMLAVLQVRRQTRAFHANGWPGRSKK